MKSSNEVRAYLKNNPKIVRDNISLFREEISEVESREPTLLAFGVDAYNMLFNNLKKYEYSKLIRLTHYSHQIGKEEYKEEVISQINEAMNY